MSDFRVTDVAVEVVLEALADEGQTDALALWIEVAGNDGASFMYDVYFQELAQADPDDLHLHFGELNVVIPKTSIAQLNGATLEVGGDGELAITNPNTPTPEASDLPDLGPEALANDLALRVNAILEEQVNPAIAAHGGYAELVGVVDARAYVLMGGGCQGCGLAAMTLSQGIATAIQEAVPEIVDIVDVTNHAAGNNPYYQPAKK
ncbi:NifU family protein [Ferrimicrobium acidiphilum]|jgi:Fe/S biogenesis protein NfuA|uniref:Fe/S biogenesis protein NfuA n=1 Tax=Ferrimicrobium acidiphilum DSM 19497 TaxID=1121877 RepID=A0A0D8FR72_9ACTN|nr:NifU family protein [Ferrimicrobium acidiphilum]KJE75773.1 Fe/S biogenesis protein NfuA [Ferrimicrobium acidiphilum DSM 19497]MCL5053021.1 NifU family protein [Gammaproteobacteria bacterium]